MVDFLKKRKYNVIMKCLNCKREISNKNKYCSNLCQKEFEYKEYIYKTATYKGANLNRGRKSRCKYKI